VPVFLCTFHVLQAWLKNIRCKLHKVKAKEAFDALYSIMYLKVVGTSEHRAAAVQEAMRAFREAFVSEGVLIEYFDKTWTAKWSAPFL
jgi:hypothetical protein